MFLFWENMENENKVVKVSDWSQKYKLVIYAVSGMSIVYVGYRIIQLLEIIVQLLEIIAVNTAK